jgi:glucose-6-phosphate isomerase
MSRFLQALHRSDNFTGAGKWPDLTRARKVDRLTGMIAGIGGSALGFPMICHNLKKPASDRSIYAPPFL